MFFWGGFGQKKLKVFLKSNQLPDSFLSLRYCMMKCLQVFASSHLSLIKKLLFLFRSQKRAAAKTQEKVESTSVTKSTSAKVSAPERARRSRSSSSGHSSSEDDSGSKAASSTPGTKETLLPLEDDFHNVFTTHI